MKQNRWMKVLKLFIVIVCCSLCVLSFTTCAKEKDDFDDFFDIPGIENYEQGYVCVYPNPTTGVLHILAVDVQKVECYNQMGQLVGVYDNEYINLGNLANGVYLLRITVPQGVTTHKVVKR